jgi:hypothetical protein
MAVAVEVVHRRAERAGAGQEDVLGIVAVLLFLEPRESAMLLPYMETIRSVRPSPFRSAKLVCMGRGILGSTVFFRTNAPFSWRRRASSPRGMSDGVKVPIIVRKKSPSFSANPTGTAVWPSASHPSQARAAGSVIRRWSRTGTQPLSPLSQGQGKLLEFWVDGFSLGILKEESIAFKMTV